VARGHIDQFGPIGYSRRPTIRGGEIIDMLFRFGIRRAALAITIALVLSSGGCTGHQLKKAFFPWMSARGGAIHRDCS
jgi:hypothetical protein